MADMPRMQKYYRETVLPEMMKHFKYPNVMLVPQLEKIVINIGVGEASQNPKLLESVDFQFPTASGDADWGICDVASYSVV